MKSGKQRRAELQAKRDAKRAAAKKLAASKRAPKPKKHEVPANAVAVNLEKLAPNNSYSTPSFVTRGYYVDIEFTCRDCGIEQTWTASQQKWWYEVAKGTTYSTAIRCRACRRRSRGE